MATQRYISTSFWDDEWIRSLDPSEKFMYLYLMTNTLTNIAGVYKISIARMCFDTGYNEDTVKKVLSRFSENKKAYLYQGYMILPTWCKHQKWEQRTKIKDGIISVLQDIPECVLEFLYSVGYLFDLSLVSETVISSKNRHQISGTTQRKVYEKYNNKCSVCGSVDNLDIHHVLPLKLGGDNSFENLQCVCRDCHIKIHSPDMLYENPIQSRYVQNYTDTDTDTDTDCDTDTKKQFKKINKLNKPTIQEIKEYADKLKYKDFDADRFFYYYEANGWVQNKNKPIVDWMAAVVNWQSNSKKFNKKDKSEKQACSKCGAYMSNGKCPRCDDV